MNASQKVSRDHVTTSFPTEYARAGEPPISFIEGVETRGDVVTEPGSGNPAREQVRLERDGEEVTPSHTDDPHRVGTDAEKAGRNGSTPGLEPSGSCPSCGGRLVFTDEDGDRRCAKCGRPT